MCELVFRLLYGLGLSDLSSLSFIGSDALLTPQLVLILVVMLAAGALTVYLFNVFLHLILKMLNRE